MIIVVANSKGGVGKSTLAVHLAAWLHEQGHTVTLADCDTQESSSQWIREAAPGVKSRRSFLVSVHPRRTCAAKRVHCVVIILSAATAFAIFLNTFRPPCASGRRPQPHKIMDILPTAGFFAITIEPCLSP